MISQFSPDEEERRARSGHEAEESVRDSMPGEAQSIGRRDKPYYLGLIKRQSEQMRGLGLLRSLGPEETAHIDAELANLNLDLLKAIARGAANLLRGN